LPQSQRWF